MIDTLWRITLLASLSFEGHHNRMTEQTGLSAYSIIGFVTIVDIARAKAFYRDTLGLRLVSEELPYALVFDANGTMLRLAINKEIPSGAGTVLGWNVPDITAVALRLKAAGVDFELYEFLEQDELGIWSAPGGARVAWFKDPDGNILSLSHHP